MDKWIPLLQSLVWPVFVTVGIALFYKDVRTLLDTARDRLGRGGAFKLGPGGIELGEIQSTPRAAIADESEHAEVGKIAGPDPRRIDGLPHTIYMTHWASRAPELDTGGLPYYRIRIALDSDSVDELKTVDRVVYHLHPTFKNPDRESTDQSKSFEIRTAGWGEFNMTAEIFRRGEASPLVVERYINFLPPAV
jgi:hypothetical protein